MRAKFIVDFTETDGRIDRVRWTKRGSKFVAGYIYAVGFLRNPLKRNVEVFHRLLGIEFAAFADDLIKRRQDLGDHRN
jgi:hypothetical protein